MSSGSAMSYWRRTELVPFLLKRQEWKCRICGEDFKRLEDACIDHDHKTGQIRGLLCNTCNIGLGGFRDDSVRLEAAIHYLLDIAYQQEITDIMAKHRAVTRAEKNERLQTLNASRRLSPIVMRASTKKGIQPKVDEMIRQGVGYKQVKAETGASEGFFYRRKSVIRSEMNLAPPRFGPKTN